MIVETTSIASASTSVIHTARSVPWASVRLVRRRNWRSDAALIRRPLGLGGVGELGRRQFLGLAEHRHPVAGGDPVVAARADDQLAVGRATPTGTRSPNSSRSVPARATPTSAATKCSLAEHHVVGAAAHAGIDHRGREEPGDVERRPRARRLFDRAPDGRVVEVGDDVDVGAQVARQERRLDVAQVAVAGADDGPRAGQPGRRSCASRPPPAAMWGQPQPSTVAACGAAGSSSTTTTATPAERSCSTVRRPTPSRPQTITWPLQSEGAFAAVTAPSLSKKRRNLSELARRANKTVTTRGSG